MDCAGKKHRARISIVFDSGRDQEWEVSPEADAAPDLTFVRSMTVNSLLEVWGDTVKKLDGDRFDPWWSVIPQPGDLVVGLADVDSTRRLDGFDGMLRDVGVYWPILALTRSGTLVSLADFYSPEAAEPVRVIASSDVARQPCTGERGLLADKASGTALVLCATNRAHACHGRNRLNSIGSRRFVRCSPDIRETLSS